MLRYSFRSFINVLSRKVDQACSCSANRGGRIMSTQQPQPQTRLDLEALGLSPEALLQAVQEYSSATGVRITFEAGSNPHVHIHFHGEIMAKKEETTTQYTDKSTGPTGAKAFGPQSSATSHGAVVQNQTLEPGQTAELVAAFTELSALLKELQLADRGRLDETIGAIEEAKECASGPEPQKGPIAAAWEKAKGWVSAALSVGTFAAAKAQEIGALIGKITGLLS
jgi:hypothetical protein